MKHLKTFEKFDNHKVNEELLGLSKEEREEKRKKKMEEAKKLIMNHKTKSKTYQDLLDKKETEKAEKYVEFFMKNPDVKYAKWDEEKKKWIEGGHFRSGGHTFGSGE
jgi:hypothetical protein